MQIDRTLSGLVTAAAALAFTSGALAGGIPHVGDIGVKFENGRIVTTIVEEDDHDHDHDHSAVRNGELGPEQRVFDSDLGTFEFGPFSNDEPGYTTNVLPAGARIGFNIRAELRRWTGSTFVGGIAETMNLGQFLGTPGEITRDTASGFVPGFYFAQADSVGFIDEHLVHTLRGPSNGPGFDDPSAGVYLLELELFTDVEGVAASEPFWIVFNLNVDQAIQDEAISYVETVIIPAPGAVAMLGLAGLVAGRRRR